MYSRLKYITVIFAYVLVGIIFVIDYYTPKGSTEWMFYLVPAALVSFTLRKNGTYIIAVICSVLIAAGLFFSPYDAETRLLTVILNRSYGVVILWIITILIKQHKSVQEAYYLNESQFETIFDQSPIGKGILNEEGILTRVNKAFVDIFGLDDSSGIIGVNLFSDPNLPGNIKEKLRNKVSVNYEIEYDFETVKQNEYYKTNRNKIAYLQEVITPLLGRDRKINGYLIQVQDITSRKNTEFSLKKAVSDLETSNKELEKFAYVASHDLQEPLRMIGSFTQLLAKRYKGKIDKDADEFISYAVEGANRMHQLINDLLTYSRLTTRAGSFIPVDCNIIIEKVRSNLKTFIDEYDARIICDQLPVILADEAQMIQLFQHLINNALKFHREGKPEIIVSSLLHENEWLFSVKDNGIGIDPAYHERIFIIFQRLNSRSNYMGTGMGLAICKKIVELHGGRIWVESKLNEGAAFYFTILKTKG